MASCLARFRHRLDRVDDRLVAGAAAVVARKIFADLLARGIGQVAQERLRRHQYPRRAESALQRVGEDESALQLLDLARVRKAFHGVHGAAVGLCGQHQAAAHDLAVDAHRAGAAHAVLAADVGAGQLELDAQEVGEVEPHGHRPFHLLAVDGEGYFDRLGGRAHATSCRVTRPASTLARCSLVAAEEYRSARGARSASSFAKALSTLFAIVGCPSSARAKCAASWGRSPTPKNATRKSENCPPRVEPCTATPTMA